MRTVVTNKHHVDQVVADYSNLSNKPKINSIELSGNKTGADLGLLTVEVDPTVPAWAKESTKPAYNYEELNYLPQINNVTVSGNKPLFEYGIQPAGSYITVETDPTVSAWAKAVTKPVYDYSEIQNTPAVNKTYTLTIDAGEWTANSYAKVITGLTNDDLVMIQAPDNYYSDYGLSYTQSVDTITFTVTSTPISTLTIGIAVTKCTAGGSL